jgi:hypothetical protein
MLRLAIVDAFGRFLYAHVGCPGYCGDAGVWNRSRFKVDNLDSDGLWRTLAAVLSVQWAGQRVEKVIWPFLVGNGAFAPSSYMQKCYPERDESLPARMLTVHCVIHERLWRWGLAG